MGISDGIEDGCRRWWRYCIRINNEEFIILSLILVEVWGANWRKLLFRHLHFSVILRHLYTHVYILGCRLPKPACCPNHSVIRPWETHEFLVYFCIRISVRRPTHSTESQRVDLRHQIFLQSLLDNHLLLNFRHRWLKLTIPRSVSLRDFLNRGMSEALSPDFIILHIKFFRNVWWMGLAGQSCSSFRCLMFCVHIQATHWNQWGTLWNCWMSPHIVSKSNSTNFIRGIIYQLVHLRVESTEDFDSEIVNRRHIVSRLVGSKRKRSESLKAERAYVSNNILRPSILTFFV
jgi:hypothetical protein